MRSDWLRIAPYLAIIISRETIAAGVLNFKLAASRFVNGTQKKVMNAMDENTTLKSQKMLFSLD